jgi:hypothetical protein
VRNFARQKFSNELNFFNRYFATVKLVDLGTHQEEVYMTPEDFLRAITPGMQQPNGKLTIRFLPAFFKKIGLCFNDICVVSDTWWKCA